MILSELEIMPCLYCHKELWYAWSNKWNRSCPDCNVSYIINNGKYITIKIERNINGIDYLIIIDPYISNKMYFTINNQNPSLRLSLNWIFPSNVLSFIHRIQEIKSFM